MVIYYYNYVIYYIEEVTNVYIYKRFLTLLLSAVMILLPSCSGNTVEETTAPPATQEPIETTSPEPSEKPFTADVFIYDFEDIYITTIRNTLDKCFPSEITANFYDADSDQATQMQQMEAAITQGTDLLIVNIVATGSEEAAMNIVNLASAAGIPLIFFNREISDDVVNAYDKCVFIGVDHYDSFTAQGELVYSIIKSDPDKYDLDGDGKFQYIMFNGEYGGGVGNPYNEYSVGEANRLLEADGLPTLEYYDPSNEERVQYCNWSYREAKNAMSSALNDYPFTGDHPIELAMANNDDMALGAIEALNEVGYNLGYDEYGNQGDYIPVVGRDCITAAKEAIAAGKMTSTISQDPNGMVDCIVTLTKNVQNGKNLMSGTDDMNIDPGVNKIRIPYLLYYSEYDQTPFLR